MSFAWESRVDAVVVVHGHGENSASDDFPHRRLDDRVRRRHCSALSFAGGACGQRRCQRRAAVVVVVVVVVRVVGHVSGDGVTSRRRGGDRR